MTLRAVLFDVDFTLAKPGPELMPDGYVRCGERHGLALEAARYEDARDAALIDLKRHPDSTTTRRSGSRSPSGSSSAWAARTRCRTSSPWSSRAAGSVTRTSSSTKT